MKSIRLTKVLLVGMVVLMTLLPAGAVYAKPPDQETTVERWDWPILQCPAGFEVWGDEIVKTRTMDFYDGEGNWTRTRIHYNFTGVWYNHDHPEIWLEENPGTYTVIVDKEGETVVVGLVQSLQLPDGGAPIFFGAGRLEFNSEGDLVFWAGPNDFIAGDVAALCAALTPP
jgi:hypothetical protein